jgi:hypothetical protein
MEALQLKEAHHLINVGNSNFIAAQEDIFNGDPATDIINLSQQLAAMFIIQKGAGATGTATITVQSCEDTDGTGATAVPFEYRKQTSGDTWGAWTSATATGFTTEAGANQMYEIWVDPHNLDGNDKYCRLKATEVVDSPCDGAMLALTIPNYAKAVPDTVLT